MYKDYLSILYDLSLNITIDLEEQKVIKSFIYKCISRLSLVSAGVIYTDQHLIDVLEYDHLFVPKNIKADISLIEEKLEEEGEMALSVKYEDDNGMTVYAYKLENVGYFFMASNDDHLDYNYDLLLNIIKRLCGSILFSKNYRELNIAKTKADEANRVKSDFVATMNHEIRTPLNAVVNATNLLKETILTTEQADFLDLINFSSEAVLGIINSSLDYIKLEKEEIEPESINFDLKESLDRIVKMLELSYSYNSNKASINYDEKTPFLINSDFNLLKQVFLNIIGNAFKFTNSGEVNISVSSDEHFIKIDVQDTGIGIDQSKRDKVFEVYNQGNTSIRRKFGGTGLGLSICKKIIKLLKGDISLESEINIGSTFSIKFPFREIVEVEAARTDEKEIGNLNLVIVEDNPVNSELLEKVLATKNLKAKVFELPLPALDYLIENHDKIDLVFMDISLPDIYGYTLTERVSSALGGKLPKIIALTANMSNEHKAKAFEVGMVDFLSKPYQFSDIFNAIKKHT